MGKQIISADSNETWRIGGVSKTWTLQAGVDLYVLDTPAVWIGKKAEHNQISILGDVINSGVGAFGVAVVGDHNSITIGRNASISGIFGVSGPAADTTVVNNGTISVLAYGIAFEGKADITNSGEIFSSLAIMARSGSLVTNEASGHIVGYDTCVLFEAGNNRLVNHGSIAGSVSGAIIDDGNRSHIVNTGAIDGLVILGQGNDVLDTRSGTISGEVQGGLGDDTYYVSSQKIDIVENDAEGADTVKSTVTYTLGDFLDNLVLIGKDDIDGTGNALGNAIAGNSGKNTLFGLDGDDILVGGLGNDRLRGGLGEDAFVFHKGDGADLILDFEHGVDTLAILETRFSGFKMLSKHFEQNGADTWILLGGDDKIVLKGIDHTLLDKNDFDFVA